MIQLPSDETEEVVTPLCYLGSQAQRHCKELNPTGLRTYIVPEGLTLSSDSFFTYMLELVGGGSSSWPIRSKQELMVRGTDKLDLGKGDRIELWVPCKCQ